MCVCVCDRQLGLDLVPRRDFGMVDPDEISITELYRLVGSHTFIFTYAHTHMRVFPLPMSHFISLLCRLYSLPCCYGNCSPT